MATEVRVGIASLVIRNEREILLGKRIGAHGVNTWAPMGGHLEFKETPIDCAIRETQEEAGILIKDCCEGPWTNDIFASEAKHYLTVFIISRYAAGEPKILEPSKCLEWCWFEWQNLPRPLFTPIKNLINKGYNIDKLIHLLPPLQTSDTLPH